jgi:hypothetical protein
LEARLNKERQNITGLERELERYGLYPGIRADRVGGFSLDDEAVVRIVGSILHDYYTSIENIFRAVAGKIDKSVPRGEQWHKELLEQMTLEVPGLRPPVIAPLTGQRLDAYRGFRHVFRNTYGFNLSFAKMQELLEALPDTQKSLARDLEEFTADAPPLWSRDHRGHPT